LRLEKPIAIDAAPDTFADHPKADVDQNYTESAHAAHAARDAAAYYALADV